MGELLSILALLMFSANILITNIASKKMDLNYGFLIALMVNIIFASILFYIDYIFFRVENFHWNSLGFLLFVLGGFFSTYLGRFWFFISITKLGPAKASVFHVSNPLFTFLIAWLFLKENLSAFDLTFIIVIIIGLFLVNYSPPTLAKTEKKSILTALREALIKERFKNSAVIIALLSGLSYGIGNVYRGAAIDHWNEPIMGALLGAFIGGFCHLLFNPQTKKVIREKSAFNKSGTLFYIVSGILTISAQCCLIAAMLYIPVSIANLITLSTPVIVTPISYFFLKNQEGITKKTIFGIVLVLLGISALIV